MNTYLGNAIASGRFQTDATTTGAGFFARGCSVARSGGAGTYRITLDRTIAPDQCVAMLNCETADKNVKVVSVIAATSQINLQVRSTAAPAATDGAVSFTIFQAAGGGGSTGL